MNRTIDESSVLTEENITRLCEPIFRKYNVKYCYLFGDYAKGTANRMSDVGLMVDCQIPQSKYLCMEKELKATLRKRIALVSHKQLSEDKDLMRTVAKCCRKIYG